MRRRRRRSDSPSPTVWIVAGVVLVLAGAGWFWYQSRGGASVDPVPGALPTASVDPAFDGSPDVPPLDLPELSASDLFIRDVVGGLSAHPSLARWLVSDELVHRFVGAVVDLAGGLSPRDRLDMMAPDDSFAVDAEGESLAVDPATYARYDMVAEAITSLDSEGSARLYHQLHPLFEEAYAELGIPEGDFDDAFSLAISNVLAARVPTAPPVLLPDEDVYVYADQALESRSPAEKHLMRMGPRNAARVQAKLRELRDAIATLGGDSRP